MILKLQKPQAYVENILNAVTSRHIDLLYARLGAFNGSFFKNGWGDLTAINLQEDLESLRDNDAHQLQVDMKKMQSKNDGPWGCHIYEGSFRTPCTKRVYDALPVESRTGRIMLALPATSGATTACVLHLAGTGDHTFSRRLDLGRPLLKEGIACMVLESPYYGARRPPYQRGSKLVHVSDLLLLGCATIHESFTLLNWANENVASRLGICGLSMGGVHAAMTAGLYPRDVAVTPLMAPRSAADAFCLGAMKMATAWGALSQFRDLKNNDVHEVIASACQEVSVLAEASWAINPPPTLRDATSIAIPSAMALESLGPKGLVPDLLAGVNSMLNTALVSHIVRSVSSRVSFQDVPYAALEALYKVLETFTDVTRFPRPRRTDAAVLVAAAHDAYVSPEAVAAVHAYWPKSELRLVPGGHVSVYLRHRDVFRSAIRDSINRL